VDSGAHAGEFFFDVLERVCVKDALKGRPQPITIHPETPLSQIVEALSNTRQQAFPVLNTDGTLYGLIDVHDIRAVLANPKIIPGLVVAQDLCDQNVPLIDIDESLASAMRKFRSSALEELPVTDGDGAKHVLGMLSRKDVSHAYYDYIHRERTTA
jgi:CBS domain-containing protein